MNQIFLVQKVMNSEHVLLTGVFSAPGFKMESNRKDGQTSPAFSSFFDMLRVSENNKCIVLNYDTS